MIARLRGTVWEKEASLLVIDVGGVGMAVLVPSPLAAQVQVGEEVDLYTHFHVQMQAREGGLSLYGFASREERDLFRQLLNVSGVGPRVALTLISALSAAALKRAILNEEPAILSRVPGIGRKTAEKIVLELKDKVSPPPELPEGVTDVHAADTEVVEALIALGYSVVEAQRAVQGLPRDVTDVGERLRLALSRLAP
ncbi:MAG: Holliday junction branch migration protein RuvA [Chloroflexi bacterium]|nr:Holliday junction branch migration protein RuvA [Chloroflexota bacterium]